MGLLLWELEGSPQFQPALTWCLWTASGRVFSKLPPLLHLCPTPLLYTTALAFISVLDPVTPAHSSCYYMNSPNSSVPSQGPLLPSGYSGHLASLRTAASPRRLAHLCLSLPFILGTLRLLPRLDQSAVLPEDEGGAVLARQILPLHLLCCPSVNNL